MVIEPRDRHIDDLTNDATPGASDHQQILRARAGTRATELTIASPFSSLLFHLSLSLSPSLSLSHSSLLLLDRPAIICYVRDSKLTAILAFCHSYVLAGRVLTPGRMNRDQHEPRTRILMRWVWLLSIAVALSLAEATAGNLMHPLTLESTTEIRFTCRGNLWFWNFNT